MKTTSNKGFTLVEILVVLVIMGLVTTAILSLFQNTQQQAYTQDNVVELQQNLRIAMDKLTEDIQMAGFLIPSTSTPVEADAPNFLCRDLNDDGDCADTGESASLTINSASPNTVVARLTETTKVDGSANTTFTFTVASAEEVDQFESGTDGDSVRIVRTPDHALRIDRDLIVNSKNRTAKTLDLKGFAAADEVDCFEGDMIILHTGGTHPESITYSLTIEGELQRDDGNGNQVVANQISDIQLSYLLRDESEVDTVTTNLNDIVGIRVTLTGTAFDINQRTDKTRQLTKVVALKNR